MVIPPKRRRDASKLNSLSATESKSSASSLRIGSRINPLSFLPPEFTPFAEHVPLATMVRGLLEWTLDEASVQSLFRDHAVTQYERELTLFGMVYLLIQVAAGVRASVFQAYQADQSAAVAHVQVSYQALYGKLARTDLAIPEALVRYGAEKLRPLAKALPPTQDQPIDGYRLRIVDGNALAGSERRLKKLRRWAAACLPGKSLVVYEPALGLVTDLVLCADAYTQERVLVEDIVPQVQVNDLWVADRGFFTAKFLLGVASRSGFFVVREHKQSLRWKALTILKKRGRNADGIIWEQKVLITNPATGETLEGRRVELHLRKPTRNGDTVIAVFTNLPTSVAAKEVLAVYLERWKVENHFQFLTDCLQCEVTGLGQPNAALCMFALAVLAGNALGIVRAALRKAHGVEQEREVSGYYLADEVAGDYRTLMKLLPAEKWLVWRGLSIGQMTQLLPTIAQAVPIKALKRHPRGPKKPRGKLQFNRKRLHVSTARLLAENTEDTC